MVNFLNGLPLNSSGNIFRWRPVKKITQYMIQRESCEGSYVILFSKKFRPFLGGASSTKLDPVGLGTVCKTIWRHFCNFPTLLEMFVLALFVFHVNVLALLVLYENVQDCSPLNFCQEKSWGSQRENIMGGDISVKIEGKGEGKSQQLKYIFLWNIGISRWKWILRSFPRRNAKVAST